MVLHCIHIQLNIWCISSLAQMLFSYSKMPGPLHYSHLCSSLNWRSPLAFHILFTSVWHWQTKTNLEFKPFQAVDSAVPKMHCRFLQWFGPLDQMFLLQNFLSVLAKVMKLNIQASQSPCRCQYHLLPLIFQHLCWVPPGNSSKVSFWKPFTIRTLSVPNFSNTRSLPIASYRCSTMALTFYRPMNGSQNLIRLSFCIFACHLELPLKFRLSLR